MTAPHGSGSRERDPRDFAPGNTLALRHGVWSPRRVDPVAEAVIDAVLARRPDLERSPEALAAWARAEARCILFADHFAEIGLFDDKGKERPGLRFVTQFERLAADLRARLGLDPRSEAELVTAQAEAARDVVDLEAIRERGRQALRRRA